ncbi:sigma factor [Thalassococcus sp. BH17M4-6]|uniref:sigma factor n=1 Tax=Thalassococcus sp. BH17M4-6 TaxID=3413148 RepID=UPI003BC47247
MQDDADIEERLERVAMGNRDAFRALYADQAPRLFGICLRILRDRSAAEDVLQEVFQTVWTQADNRLASGLAPQVWLITLARDTALAHRARSRAGADQPCVDDRDGGEDAFPATAEAERHMMLRRAYLDGEGYAALSRRAGVSAEAFRPWFRRCLTQLRQESDQ